MLIIDTNILIQAKNNHYAFDIAPSFWDALIKQGGLGNVCSTEHVRDELVHYGDNLSTWIKDNWPYFEDCSSAQVAQNYADLMRWGQTPGAIAHYHEQARHDFASGIADPWLIAYAKEIGGTVVTSEANNPQAKRTIPIPVVCDAFSVDWCDCWTMMRKLNIRL